MELNKNTRREFVEKALLASTAITLSGTLPGFRAGPFARQSNCLGTYISDANSNPSGLLDGFHIQNMLNSTSVTLHTNPQNGLILNNPKAMQLWSRSYEKGWEPRV